ncbi:MAG: LLM class flavin-dependent oxidoreductase [Actinomycetia bacterium]|nr:LLM class flavin-dependent oxidoreductase [Actinomycetes bacterium]MCP4957956.1 LLM class flavin-dependent oxidoreductase [Actinomycetes bacterium]
MLEYAVKTPPQHGRWQDFPRCVVCYRHPAFTANMATTVDIISGGLFELGMGAGWNVGEPDSYGIELGAIKQRLDRFEEGVEVIVRLLGQEVAGFVGE